jgi:hypothetical protein
LADRSSGRKVMVVMVVMVVIKVVIKVVMVTKATYGDYGDNDHVQTSIEIHSSCWLIMLARSSQYGLQETRITLR